MDIFLTDQNSISERYAVFEDDGISGWLYITEVGEPKPAGDCWIYNRIPAPAPDDFDVDQYQNGPPPAPSNYSKEGVHQPHPENSNHSFLWSSDGSAVALIINNIPMGFVRVGEKCGWSKNLKCSGPWGNVFDEQLFSDLFMQ